MNATTEARTLTGVAQAGTSRHAAHHRKDIQGLRAVLMLQVLLFHAWTVGSPIGVDAFILVSAFLMTSSFVRRSESGRMPFFIERWGNTFKRLLPPLVTVVLATLGATLLFLPATRWRETTIQAFASITYWENWRLVDVAADYYADDHALASPLQHLWSMSMQGQMFLLWPVLMTLCVLAARRLRLSIRGVVITAFGMMTVASLIWLLLFAPADGSVYFDTRARIWEFSFGSMVAAAAPWLKVGPRAARAISAIGMIVLLVFCLVPIGTYPGPMAFFPMVSVSALLLYIPALKGKGADQILSLSPLVLLGDISYCVYLVHWPLFVIYQAVYAKPNLSLLEGCLLISVSILLAWVLTKLVDDPIRTNSWLSATTPRKYSVIAVSLIVGLLPVSGTYLWIQRQSERGAEATADLATTSYQDVPLEGPGSDSYPGARVLMESTGELDFTEPPIPDPVSPAKYSRWPDECPEDFRSSMGGAKGTFCFSYGDLYTSTGRVLVAGSSHAQQLLVAQLEPFMSANELSGYTVLRGGCSWTAPGTALRDTNPECETVNQGLWDQLDAYRPDYAFLVVTTSGADPSAETLVPGVIELVKEMTARGIEVVGVRDNLRASFDLRECSLERPYNKPFGGCLLKESNHFPDTNPAAGLESIDGFHLIDYRDMYCVDGVCPTIIGNIFVYFDAHHIGGEYAISMAPFFSERVAEAVGLED